MVIASRKIRKAQCRGAYGLKGYQMLYLILVVSQGHTKQGHWFHRSEMRRNVDGSHGHPLGRTHIHFKPLSFCRCIFPGPSDRWISLRQQIWAGFARCTCCNPSIRMELPCDHIRVAVWLCSLWHNMNQLERNLVQCCIGGNEALDVQIWQGRKPFAGHFFVEKIMGVSRRGSCDRIVW